MPSLKRHKRRLKCQPHLSTLFCRCSGKAGSGCHEVELDDSCLLSGCDTLGCVVQLAILEVVHLEARPSSHRSRARETATRCSSRRAACCYSSTAAAATTTTTSSSTSRSIKRRINQYVKEEWLYQRPRRWHWKVSGQSHRKSRCLL